MNRIYIYPHELDLKNTAIIRDPVRISHVQNILKSKPGDEIKILVLNVGIGVATLEALSEQEIELRISNLESPVVHGALDELWIGACRPQTVKKILEYASSLGVAKLKFFKAELSEKSYLSSNVFHENEISFHLAQGLAQSNIHYTLPEVEVVPYLPVKMPTVLGFYFSFNTKHNFFSPSGNLASPLTLAFGPERGFTAREEDHFRQNGLLPLNLHPSTLRLEVAVISALSLLHARRNFLA